MQRIRQEIAAKTRLEETDKGDLWIRIRPSEQGGWETLVRMFPRPLSTRAWRVCNYEASLNATVAHAMALMTQPTDEDVVLNMGCGSATLLIERAARPVNSLIGIDHDPTLLECARENIEASGMLSIQLIQADLHDVPLPDHSVNVLLADLPFGQNVGSHEDNLALYPVILKESARIARTDARFALITHEIRLIEQLLNQHPAWVIEQSVRVTLRGLHPRIYVLRRSNQTI